MKEERRIVGGSKFGSMVRILVVMSVLIASLGTLIVAAPAKAQTSIVSAVLPSSRSVQVGATATVFATVINTGGFRAVDCIVSAPLGFPGSFSFQTTDAATNTLVGNINTPVDIPVGGAQTFALFITPNEAFDAIDLAVVYSCQNAAAASLVGINTLQLSASDSPVLDIVALAATEEAGLVTARGDNALEGSFAVAALNLGLGGPASVIMDFGGASLPLEAGLCETDPDTGVCLHRPIFGRSFLIDNGAMSTFAVFFTPISEIRLDPAVNRIFLRFRDGFGVVRGSTSVAVAAPPPLTVDRFTGSYIGTFSGDFFGTFSISIDSTGAISGTGQVLESGTVFDVQGAVIANGSFQFNAGGTSIFDGAHFSGTITNNRNLSGSWRGSEEDVVSGDGTFLGDRRS